MCMGRARVSSPGGEATAVRVLGDCSALQRAAGGGRRLTGVASGSRGATGDPRDVGWELLCGEVKSPHWLVWVREMRDGDQPTSLSMHISIGMK